MRTLIETRNKNKMLRACKEKTAFITRVTGISKYNRKCVIMQLGRCEKESKGGVGRKKFREGDVQITRRLWSLADYMNAKYFHAGIGAG